MKPPIFFVSSQLAQKAKFSGSALEADALLGASGFADLERYVTDLLDEEGRVRLKLESPLGVVEELVRRYRLAVEERVSLLEDDFKMAENVESQLEAYKEDMKRDFEARMAEIENIILSMNERGDEWFEENIRLANVRELVQREKVQDRFQREVVANTEGLIDERVEELIDWMVDRNLKEWRAVVEYVNRRRQVRYNEQIIGEIGDNFEYNRSQLLHSVGKNATDIVQRYDREYESQQLALSLQGAVAQTAAVEVGALGLGAAFVAVATTAAADVTGITAALLIASFGLFILPRRRRKARRVPREDRDFAGAPGRGSPSTVQYRAGPLRREDARGDSPVHPLRPHRARSDDRGSLGAGGDYRRGRNLTRGDRGARGQITLALRPRGTLVLVFDRPPVVALTQRFYGPRERRPPGEHRRPARTTVQRQYHRSWVAPFSTFFASTFVWCGSGCRSDLWSGRRCRSRRRSGHGVGAGAGAGVGAGASAAYGTC